MTRSTISRLRRSIGAGAILSVSLMIPVAAFGQDQSQGASTTAPNNSAQNRGQHLTADQQSNRHSDIAITEQIRRSVIADSSLSTDAHNVKIITRKGMVTLKGPVASEQEKQTIAGKAEAVVGSSDKVSNKLTVNNSGN